MNPNDAPPPNAGAGACGGYSPRSALTGGAWDPNAPGGPGPLSPASGADAFRQTSATDGLLLAGGGEALGLDASDARAAASDARESGREGTCVATPCEWAGPSGDPGIEPAPPRLPAPPRAIRSFSISRRAAAAPALAPASAGFSAPMAGGAGVRRRGSGLGDSDSDPSDSDSSGLGACETRRFIALWGRDPGRDPGARPRLWGGAAWRGGRVPC